LNVFDLKKKIKKTIKIGSPRVLYEESSLFLWEMWWNFSFEITFFFSPLSKKRFYNRFTFILLLAVTEDLEAQSTRLLPIKRFVYNPLSTLTHPGILIKSKHKIKRQLNLQKQYKLLMLLIKSNIDEWERKNIKVKSGVLELYSLPLHIANSLTNEEKLQFSSFNSENIYPTTFALRASKSKGFTIDDALSLAQEEDEFDIF